jgi:hypothetical protein
MKRQSQYCLKAPSLFKGRVEEALRNDFSLALESDDVLGYVGFPAPWVAIDPEFVLVGVAILPMLKLAPLFNPLTCSSCGLELQGIPLEPISGQRIERFSFEVAEN